MAYNLGMSGSRMARWLILMGALAAAAGAACKTEAPRDSDDDAGERESKKSRRAAADDDEPPRDDAKVARELKRWVRAAQHSAFVEGDEAAYYRIYADAGQVVIARGEEPHPHDYLIPVKRTQEFLRVRGKVAALEGYVQRYENETEKLAGDEAVFRWDVHASWKAADGQNEAVYGERYKLLHADGKWRVSEKRTWTVSVTRPPKENELAAYPKGVVSRYDDRFWAALDEDVDRARLMGGAPLFWALTNAGRHPEAYQLAKMVTADPRATGEAHYLLALAAWRLNYGEETKAAFAKARALDPRIHPPPPWGPKQEQPPGDAAGDTSFVDLMRRASTL